MIPHVTSLYKKKPISDITLCTLPTPKSISSLTNFAWFWKKRIKKKTKKLNNCNQVFYYIFCKCISLEIEITMYCKQFNKFELIIKVDYEINNTFTLWLNFTESV
jgi:hypothetical protein